MTTIYRSQRADDAPDSPAISSDTFQALVEMIGPDVPEQVAEFVDIYLDQASHLLAILATASECGDSAELLLAVHSLKSISSIVGALEFSARSTEMERALRTGDSAYDWVAARSAMAAEYSRVTAALIERKRLLLSS